MACHRGGKSTPNANQTWEKCVVPGEPVMEETLFPALHGTLVKVGGHLIQRTEECEALTTPQ